MATTMSVECFTEQFEREKAISWFFSFHSELWSTITRTYALKAKMESVCEMFYDKDHALILFGSSDDGKHYSKQQTQASNNNGDKESMMCTSGCMKYYHCTLHYVDGYLNRKNKRSQSNVNSQDENFSCDGFTSHFLVFIIFASIGEFHLKSNGKVHANIDCGGEINGVSVNILQVPNSSMNSKLSTHRIETGFVMVLMLQRTQLLNFKMGLFATGRGRYESINLIVLSLVKNHCLPSNAQCDDSVYRWMVQIVKLENDKSDEIDLVRVQNNRLVMFSDLQEICSVVSKLKKIRSVCSEWMEFHLVLSDQKIHTVFCELKRMVVHHGNGLIQLRTDDGGLKNFCGNWDLCLCKFVYRHNPYNIERDGDVDNERNEVEVGKVCEEDPINSFYQKVSAVCVRNALWKIGQAVNEAAKQWLAYQLEIFWWIQCIVFTDAVKRTLVTVEVTFSVQ